MATNTNITRRPGAPTKLFNYCQTQAKELGFKQLFCLTTHTEHWFLERGFVQKSIDELPHEKQKMYNFQRNSKVFIKSL